MEACRNSLRQMWRQSKVSPPDARFFFLHLASLILFSMDHMRHIIKEYLLICYRNVPSRNVSRIRNHEDCVQCHMVNRFPLAMLDWLINEVVQFGRKQWIVALRTENMPVDFKKAYSICLGGRATTMLYYGYQQIRDAGLCRKNQHWWWAREWAWCLFATSSKI